LVISQVLRFFRLSLAKPHFSAEVVQKLKFLNNSILLILLLNPQREHTPSLAWGGVFFAGSGVTLSESAFPGWDGVFVTRGYREFVIARPLQSWKTALL
jgi:hypothetical protein